ncbi:hypothetical protein LMOSLCC2755_0864 [Listeria monocytogenes SLCC2755]|nr:hypothetical protein A409_0911 [Listeria monocytogenes serotype 1/2b str. 10-0810]ASH37787.1 hypothetical protein A410_0919 [Listeria monocytogenes serotype 1/2b str. 10-0811]EAL10252.1 hypothetical protein LMOh7858_0923 [Listeria monocytogenes str. 4b H7858] [Listeria monocytogenes serotype 4b str. H7858]KHK39647.1 hypothetical protein I619_01140 [Listeria monocytogenes SHL010]CBY48456.1 hypothetical protein LMOSLCC2755_0864 [Listeria monocytogenes SLCC2755]
MRFSQMGLIKSWKLFSDDFQLFFKDLSIKIAEKPG